MYSKYIYDKCDLAWATFGLVVVLLKVAIDPCLFWPSNYIMLESVSESESLENILQLSNRPYSAGNRLKMCCRPSYRIRKLKNKGAILLLVWNYLVLSVFYYHTVYPNKFPSIGRLYSIVWGLSLPIAGCLADVCLGRYKIIRWSILIMWIASILVVVSSILSQFVESYYYAKNNYITSVLFIVMCIAFGAYQANIVLFGIDQLQDASTDEITSFISWYLCTWFSGMVLNYFIDLCLSGRYGGLLHEFAICICLTLMVILAIIFDRAFLKEPITQNPFQLIYKVIKYAIKTKHPRCRSAFTYCEDELPSRIDFGKRKYGGPFTTEEVENVKTFLRLLVIINVVSTVSISSFFIEYKFILKKDRENIISFFLAFHRSSQITAIDLVYFSGAVLIALYEFTFYPLLQKYLPCIHSYHWKLYVGAISQMARIIALITIDLTARHSYIKHNNSTIQCIFVAESGILDSNFNMKWMILPCLLDSISAITFIVGSFELICSQSPYSMRGLLFGAMYGCVVLYGVIGYRISKPFTKYSKQVWGTGIISCEFWYLLLILLFLVAYNIMLCILMKWYKNRKREDVLPNEQIFAERYYTRYSDNKFIR